MAQCVNASGLETELSWFAHLGRAAGQALQKVRRVAGDAAASDVVHHASPRSGSAARDGNPWMSFDMADIMEQGTARMVTAAFLVPPPAGQPPKQLLVERSEDHSRFVLKSEDDEPLLLARVSEDGKYVNIDVPTGGDPPTAVGPVFTLAASDDKKSEWVFSCTQCDCSDCLSNKSTVSATGACQRDLAYIRSSVQQVNRYKCVHNAVDLPPLDANGIPAVWCKESADMGSREKVRLESRMPKYDRNIDALTQNFFGRCTKASNKNVQMEVSDTMRSDVDAADASARRPEFLHGKVGRNTFVLDYAHPLSMAQAFAIALSTKDLC